MSINLPLITSTVSMKKGQAVCNSRAVAEVFGKQHKDVLRAIDRLECSRNFIERNFTPNNYKDPRGRLLRSLDMTKDGFVFLVMGFTGRDAARFKEAYIQRFNEMEAELREIHRSSHLGNVTVHEFFLGEHRLRALATARGPRHRLR